jgi:hypothetical protein
MDFQYYLDQFKTAAGKFDKKLLDKKEILAETGIWLDSVVLRLQKKHWTNKPFEKPQSGSSIFFSIWLNDKAAKDSKILYNIHALKLRQLNGYSITSREFADAFREKFKKFESRWPNSSVDYGPQTLMQGWKKLDLEHLQKDIIDLATKFLEIDFLIDDLLNKYKSPITKGGSGQFWK